MSHYKITYESEFCNYFEYQKLINQQVLHGKLNIDEEKVQYQEEYLYDNNLTHLLLENHFKKSGYHINGWNLKIIRDGETLWYCIDGNWKSDEVLNEDIRCKKYVFSDKEEISQLPINDNENLVLVVQWEKTLSKKEDIDETYYLHYHSDSICKETYSPLISSGIIRGKIIKTPKKAYEFKEERTFKNSERITLLKNFYSREGYTFIGWNVRRKCENVWEWYCNDGNWRKATEIEANSKIQKYYFSDGEEISSLPMNDENRLIMVAQWEENTDVDSNFDVNYLVFYHSNVFCEESYSKFIANGLIRGELVKTPKNAYEFREQIPFNNSKITPLLKNCYVRKGYNFVGWNVRKRVDNIWKWYCTDNVWRKATEIENDALIQKYCFSNREQIGLLPIDEGDKLIMTAQWEEQVREAKEVREVKETKELKRCIFKRILGAKK
jgi:hypothetical protein